MTIDLYNKQQWTVGHVLKRQAKTLGEQNLMLVDDETLSDEGFRETTEVLGSVGALECDSEHRIEAGIEADDPAGRTVVVELGRSTRLEIEKHRLVFLTLKSRPSGVEVEEIAT